MASVYEIGKREQRQNAQRRRKRKEDSRVSGTRDTSLEFVVPDFGLRFLRPRAHREGNHRHNADSNHDPTIARQADIKVEIQVATDIKLWHNRLARGKYVRQHLVNLVKQMTQPSDANAGLCRFCTLLSFDFGAIARAVASQRD